MASRVFDFQELDEFADTLISNAMRDHPNQKISEQARVCLA